MMARDALVATCRRDIAASAPDPAPGTDAANGRRRGRHRRRRLHRLEAARAAAIRGDRRGLRHGAGAGRVLGRLPAAGRDLPTARRRHPLRRLHPHLQPRRAARERGGGLVARLERAQPDRPRHLRRGRARLPARAAGGAAARAGAGRGERARGGAERARRGSDTADADLAAAVRHLRHADRHPQRAAALPGAGDRAAALQPRDHLRRGRAGGALGRARARLGRGDRRQRASAGAVARVALGRDALEARGRRCLRGCARGAAADGAARDRAGGGAGQPGGGDLLRLIHLGRGDQRDQLRLPDDAAAGRRDRDGDLHGGLPAALAAGRAGGSGGACADRSTRRCG